MTRQEPTPSRTVDDDRQEPQPTTPFRPAGEIDLDRWADLLARGECPFPQGLAPDAAGRLIRMLSERRRRGLLEYIARAIAQDICREPGLLQR